MICLWKYICKSCGSVREAAEPLSRRPWARRPRAGHRGPASVWGQPEPRLARGQPLRVGPCRGPPALSTTVGPSQWQWARPGPRIRASGSISGLAAARASHCALGPEHPGRQSFARRHAAAATGWPMMLGTTPSVAACGCGPGPAGPLPSPRHGD